MEKKKHRNGFFGITARALMLMAAGLLVVSYLSMIVNPAKAWFMTLLGLMFIPAAFLNLFLLIWALRRRSKSIVIPLVALIPAFLLAGRYFQFSAPEVGEDESGIKIMTYNVGRFASAGKKLDTEACTDSVVNYLNKSGADIICLQEFRLWASTDIKKYLKKNFPGYDSEYYMYTGSSISFGNVILSKLPIKGKDKFDFGNSANLALYADIKAGDRTIRVYNCHFESYGISIPGIFSAIRHKNEEVVKDAEHRLESSIKQRPEQVEQVLQSVKECPTESFIVGDFNDTPLSYTYFKLSKDHKDSFIEGGKGFGSTYRDLWPLLRIDYILCPREYKALRHKIDRIKLSDHFPIMSEIKFDSEQK